MQKHLRLLAVPILVAALSVPAGAQDAGAPDGDTIVATVNGQEITLGHLIAARATLDERFDKVPADELYNGILRQMIQQAALAQTVDQLPPLVVLTLENEERSLKAAEAIENRLVGVVTEEDIQAAYDDAIVGFETKEEYNASHILLPTQEEAQAVKDAIDGGADFAATARESSTGPSGPNGGALGWFGTGMMVPDFEAATIALEVGQVSDPIETQFGWHVIKLNDVRKTEPPTLESMRADIERNLRTAAATEIIDGSTEGVTVVIPEDTGVTADMLTQRELVEP